MNTSLLIKKLKVKIDRNDPCFCGSGKKYKKCCLENFRATETFEYKYFALLQLRQKIFKKIFNLLSSRFSDDFFESMFSSHWQNPLLDDEQLQILQDHKAYNQYLVSTTINYLVHQILNPNSSDLWLDSLSFLKDKITPIEYEFISSLEKQHCSFFQIKSKHTDGLRIELEDIFSGEKFTIVDRGLNNSGSIHCIILGILFPFIENTWFLEASGNFPFLPTDRTWIIDFLQDEYTDSEEEEPTIQEFLRNNLQLLIWLDMVQALAHVAPQMPQVSNQSGDEIVLTKATYIVKNMEVVLEKLQKIEGISLDDQNKKKYELKWLNEKNLVLGLIELDQSSLILATNSISRFRKFQKLVSSIKELILQDTRQENLEQAFKRAKPRDKSLEEPLEQPKLSREDMSQIAEQHFADYYDNWIHEKIPILGNKTPLQACKTARGRQQVEDLLNEYEVRNQGMTEDDMNFYFDTDKLRQKLDFGQFNNSVENELEIFTLTIKLGDRFNDFVWQREIEAKETMKLSSLHNFIQKTIEFDNDHMYEFYVGKNPRNRAVVGKSRSLNEVFPLEGMKLFYLFDFGDSWLFQISKKRKRKFYDETVKYPRVISAKGENPPQYGNFEEE